MEVEIRIYWAHRVLLVVDLLGRGEEEACLGWEMAGGVAVVAVDTVFVVGNAIGIAIEVDPGLEIEVERNAKEIEENIAVDIAIAAVEETAIVVTAAAVERRTPIGPAPGGDTTP